MVIAVLALLGVDLVVLVVFLVFVLSRKRWVDRQPGAFKGAIRLADGELEGIAPTWRRGYGRWVLDVFVWTKAPFLFRNDLLPRRQRRGATHRCAPARSSDSLTTPW
jgi:hypothetical protein